MKIGIISDIHSNLESFQSAIKFYEKNNIDKLIICGDIIGYGPDPSECINLAEKNADIILKGNHEDGILKNDFLRFKKYAKISLEWTAKEIREEIEQIKKWEDKKEIEDLFFVHGSITDPYYKYIFNIIDAEDEFKNLEKRICFVGHTHIPVIFRKKIETKKTEKIPADFSGKIEIEIEENFKYIINVGSVGFPRDGYPFSCVSIYDTEKKIFKLERIEYETEKTIKKILEKGLPSKICSFLKGF
ncbi:MAG: metallophosphoesterase family protein [Candidatus Omnitrophica bacterium]|nr:metallophosphoesterase family protein [Candidatus Omnitrophota bacterium]MCM8802369.1 metallophosphoesterase family protein [Candidatus Omnitrophota bacterium]